MTFDEALVIVRRGGKVSRSSDWLPCAAGYEWGPWLSFARTWTEGDFVRMRKRDAEWSEVNRLPPVNPSGPFAVVYNTLCESFMLNDELLAEMREANDDWLDVTDRFDSHGLPLGHFEHMTRGENNG